MNVSDLREIDFHENSKRAALLERGTPGYFFHFNYLFIYLFIYLFLMLLFIYLLIFFIFSVNLQLKAHPR